MVQMEIIGAEQQENEPRVKPILDLTGMKNPDRYRAVKSAMESLQFAGDVEDQISRTMPEDLKRYSARNQILIRLQRPDVQVVKGRNQWFQEGRKLVKGCHAIWILAPSTKKKKAKKPDEEDQEQLKGFYFIPVYDQRDTEPKQEKEA